MFWKIIFKKHIKHVNIKQFIQKAHHIKHVNTKLSKSIGILYKIYKYLPISTLKLLYHTFIRPYITYGIEAWYNADKTYTNNVFMMQKKVIRFISKIGYREHTISKLWKFWN